MKKIIMERLEDHLVDVLRLVVKQETIDCFNKDISLEYPLFTALSQEIDEFRRYLCGQLAQTPFLSQPRNFFSKLLKNLEEISEKHKSPMGRMLSWILDSFAQAYIRRILSSSSYSLLRQYVQRFDMDLYNDLCDIITSAAEKGDVDIAIVGVIALEVQFDYGFNFSLAKFKFTTIMPIKKIIQQFYQLFEELDGEENTDAFRECILDLHYLLLDQNPQTPSSDAPIVKQPTSAQRST